MTNLRQTPRFIYEKVYCARGDIENRIKELLDGLQIDRTSCCLFSANQLRVFLTAAAYVLMQELRLRAARTACPQPGDVAARPAAEAGGPRRPLGPPRGSASAALDAAPRGVAAHRTRAGRARRIAHPLRRAHLLPGRHGPLRRRGCRCPTLASVMPPGRLLKPRLRLQAAMSETHSCAGSRPLAVESGPSVESRRGA